MNIKETLEKSLFLAKLNFFVLILTQRGYFPSEGKPSFCGQKNYLEFSRQLMFFSEKIF